MRVDDKDEDEDEAGPGRYCIALRNRSVEQRIERYDAMHHNIAYHSIAWEVLSQRGSLAHYLEPISSLLIGRLYGTHDCCKGRTPCGSDAALEQRG